MPACLPAPTYLYLPPWPRVCVQYAQAHVDWVVDMERQLAAFLADKAAKRVSVAPGTKVQRAMLHELAEQYGLATVSTG